jgi:predicted RNA-binding protein
MTWQNVVVNTAADKSFNPPLDAIYVTTAGNDAALTIYVNDVDSGISATDLTAKTHLQIGHITRIDGDENNLRYIGIRHFSDGAHGAITDS